MNKENVIYSHNGIILSNQKEQTTDTCYNMNKAQTHHPRWKKAGDKDYIFYDSIFIKCLEKQINRDRKQIDQWLPRTKLGVGINCRWEGRKLVEWWEFLTLDCEDSYTALLVYQDYGIIQVRWVKFTVCKLYLLKAIET